LREKFQGPFTRTTIRNNEYLNVPQKILVNLPVGKADNKGPRKCPSRNEEANSFVQKK